MKQKLIPQQKLTIAPRYNASFKNSLTILSFSADQLQDYLYQLSCENESMMFHSTADSDAFLNYDYSLPSLYDTVMEQLRFGNESYDEDICEYLIFQLDSNGYFRSTDIFQHPLFSKESIEKHLNLLRTCEPYGCFAFSLKQCLQLQCLHHDEPIAKIAYQCCEYLNEIVNREFDYVCKQCQISLEQLQQAFAFIQTLNPKPASGFASFASYATPEFKLEIVGTTIQIEPIDAEYQFSFDSSQITSSDYTKQQRKQFDSIMNAIQKRNSTLLMIMQTICEKQKDFFLYGKPLVQLTLQEVADNCGLHVSTISRAIQNKSFELNRRYIMMRQMFVRSGTVYSDGVIKELLKQLIQQENKKHPYSDEKLSKLLAKQNIKISRRTIAKYRQQCHIPNASQRKSI